MSRAEKIDHVPRCAIVKVFVLDNQALKIFFFRRQSYNHMKITRLAALYSGGK